MQNMLAILMFVGSINILVGYLRFIVDENGNIPLLSYRLSGCLGAVLLGMFEGTQDLLSRQITNKALSALMIYVGLGLYLIVFSQGN